MRIGTDIIQIKRVDILTRRYGEKFRQHFLNDEEIALARRVETTAGFWAAKEAISKALGCGIGKHLTFHDIIISKDTLGAPTFRLSPKAQQIHKVKNASLSISHDGGFAIAVAVVTKDQL